MAAAQRAERRHRFRDPSPLAGVSYDGLAGEYDMHRFVSSPVDEAVGSFAERFDLAAEEERARLKDALTMDDLYTLMTFARRCVLRSLRGAPPELLRAAAAALRAVDERRVDVRDVAWATALVAWAAQRAGIDSSREPVRLADWGYRCVDVGNGPVLVGEHGERFEPETDLVAAAFDVAAAIEADAYRVTDLAAGARLPDVWLRMSPAVEAALGAVRGCVSMHGALDPDAGADADSQQLTAWLVEASDEHEASALAAAAVSTDDHEAIGRSRGRLCCVLVGRSFVDGVRAHEPPGALERFGAPLEGALRR
jgi:hypothetical protein